MATSVNFDKLPIEDALEDSPQVRTLLGAFQNDANNLRQYMITLHHLSSKLVSAHNLLTSTYQDLAKHLNVYPKKFLIQTETEELASELNQFSSVLSEMSSLEHIVSTQLADSVVYPLSKFVTTDLQEVEMMGNLHQSASQELDRALTRYSKCRKRDAEQEFHESCEDVYISKKKFHQMALHYYAKLNLLQVSRRTVLLEVMLGLLTGCKAHHNLAYDSLSNSKVDESVTGLDVHLKSLQKDCKLEYDESLELIDSIIVQSQLMYYAQPPPILGDQPLSEVSNKSGYLHVQKKYMAGVMSSWERQFVFMEAGNLMGVSKGEVVGTLLLEIEASTFVHAFEADDRRHVFQVSTAKKSVTLQALNDRERDQWMLALHNAAKTGGFVREGKFETVHSSLLAGVGNYFADKLHAASAALGGGATVGTVSPYSTPSTPSTGGSAGIPSSPPADMIPFDSPIVFDLLSSGEGSISKDCVGGGAEVTHETQSSIETSFENSFSVRFLGSMAIKVDRGHGVVCEVMRRILAARAIHNVFSTAHVMLTVDDSHVTLSDDGTTKCVRLRHRVSDLTYWAVHNENNKLFGYITRSRDSSQSVESSFNCFIFEADCDAFNVCSCIEKFARASSGMPEGGKRLEGKRSNETQLLLANISQLPDIDDGGGSAAGGETLQAREGKARSSDASKGK